MLDNNVELSSIVCASFRRIQSLCFVFSHPDVLRVLGWRDVMRLRSVSASLRKALDNGEDGFKLLSTTISDDVGKACNGTLVLINIDAMSAAQGFTSQRSLP